MMADDERYGATRAWRKVAPCSRAVFSLRGILWMEYGYN